MAPPAGAVSTVGLYDCNGVGHRRPAAFNLACGDGNRYFDRAVWSSWGTRTAVGTAREWYNTCEPSCSAGNYQFSRVGVRLDVARTLAGHRYFARIRIGGAHPDVIATPRPRVPVVSARTFYDRNNDVRHALDIHTVQVINRRALTVTVRFDRLVYGGLMIYIDTGGRVGPNRQWISGVAGATDWEVYRVPDSWTRGGTGPLNCSSHMYRTRTTVRAVMSRGCLPAGTGRVRVNVLATPCVEGGCRIDYAPGAHRYYSWVRRG
jgi:hypothetical protein